MKATIAVTALACLASSVSAQYFGVIAARSASPIHLQPWAANGQKIWIGKDTASYCPKATVGARNCPKGVETNFAGGDGSLSMGTVVPGGQQVYVNAQTGALGFTQAHSASTPEGARLGGWSLEEGENFGTLSRPRDLLACSKKGDANKGPWQVYVALKGLTFGDECLSFNALTVNNTKPDAWQYT